MIETRFIKYTEGYKYILEEDAWFYTGIKEEYVTKKVLHHENGWMVIKAGFGWDGPSGITHDDKYNMRGALCHDGGYYLLRHGFNPKYRIIVFDALLKRLMEEDANYILQDKKFAYIRKLFFKKIRPDYYKFAVGEFGMSSADPKNKRKILQAP